MSLLVCTIFNIVPYLLANRCRSLAAAISIITFALSFISVYLGHKWGKLCKFKLEIIGGIILLDRRRVEMSTFDDLPTAYF